MLLLMGDITGISSALSASGTEGGTSLTMLKKSQDLMSQQAEQLLAALPASLPPSPAGVGGRIDLLA